VIVQVPLSRGISPIHEQEDDDSDGQDDVVDDLDDVFLRQVCFLTKPTHQLFHSRKLPKPSTSKQPKWHPKNHAPSVDGLIEEAKKFHQDRKVKLKWRILKNDNTRKGESARRPF
jgi:hypothetical protein